MKSTADLREPERNAFFYGKLLGVHQLELEQDYFNSKRWLLNRLVTGPGVVCGLDVQLTEDNSGIVVSAGLAIDRCGREIIVPKSSHPVQLPPMPSHDGGGPEQSYSKYSRHDYCEEEYAHVLICYHECKSDPVPAMAGDCETVAFCVADSIREKYKIEIREGYAPERKSAFPDVVEGRRINYPAIVEYVTRGCRALPDDCCIPLADIRLRSTGKGWEPEVDINVRPIVYNNRLLFELIKSLVIEEEKEY
jgi:hypothetical protein